MSEGHFVWGTTWEEGLVGGHSDLFRSCRGPLPRAPRTFIQTLDLNLYPEVPSWGPWPPKDPPPSSLQDPPPSQQRPSYVPLNPAKHHFSLYKTSTPLPPSCGVPLMYAGPHI